MHNKLVVEDIRKGVYSCEGNFSVLLPNVGIYACKCGNIGAYDKSFNKRNFRCVCGKKISAEYSITTKKKLSIWDLNNLVLDKYSADRYTNKLCSIELLDSGLSVTYLEANLVIDELDNPSIIIGNKNVIIELEKLTSAVVGKITFGLANPMDVCNAFIRDVVAPYLITLQYEASPEVLWSSIVRDSTLDYISRVLKVIDSPCMYTVLNNNIDIFNDKLNFSYINTDATNIEDLLGVSKSMVKPLVGYLRKNDFAAVNKLIESLRTSNIGVVNNIIELTVDLGEAMCDLIEAYNLPKYKGRVENDIVMRDLSFLLERNFNYTRLKDYILASYDSQGVLPTDFLGLLKDYVSMAIDMGLKYEKYPRSVRLEHDLLTVKYNLVQNKVQDEKLQKIGEDNAWRNVKGSTYSAIMLKSSQDFVDEGNLLDHCVSSYAKKVVNGECLIMSIRENSDLTTPVATIEIVDDRVVQLKGKHNSVPVVKVGDFVATLPNIWLSRK